VKIREVQNFAHEVKALNNKIRMNSSFWL